MDHRSLHGHGGRYTLFRTVPAEQFGQVEYLAGNFLAHTVYTLLCVHHVADMEVDLVSSDAPQDPSRPIHLVTTVLRSAVQGMLKCCDLTWRELARGSTYDVRPPFLVRFFRIEMN